MTSAKFWVRSALAVTALAFASGASAAVTYGWVTNGTNTTTGGLSWDVPTGNYDDVGGSSNLVAGAGFIIPTFKSATYDYKITEALLTIYLADDNDSGKEWAVINGWSKTGSVVSNLTKLTDDTTAGPTGILRSFNHNQSDGSASGYSGTYEVDGKQCSSGWVTSTTCQTSAYDAYTFDVTTLLKEGETFNFSVASKNTGEDFWYKGAYLSIAVAKVKVPEPATLGLLGLGLIGIGLSRRRKAA